jgi:hypothetical protein
METDNEQYRQKDMSLPHRHATAIHSAARRTDVSVVTRFDGDTLNKKAKQSTETNVHNLNFNAPGDASVYPAIAADRKIQGMSHQARSGK